MDLTGQVFGQLSVVTRVDGLAHHYGCLCTCGQFTVGSRGNLRNGHKKSCGCLKFTSRRTHGFASRRFIQELGRYPAEYRSWKNMKNRCGNPKGVNYADYGGRGIKVCDRWVGVEGFANFLADVGFRPEPKSKYSLDRFPNNDGNYEPGNVRWATKSQQSLNQRLCRAVENFSDEVLIAEVRRRNLVL